MSDFKGFNRIATATCLAALLFGSGVAVAAEKGWSLEAGVEEPSYAVADAYSDTLNVDAVALVCEEAGSQRGLQLQLYPTVEGMFLPRGASEESAKPEARAEMEIDGKVFPMSIAFSEQYLVVADAEHERHPVLSEAATSALASGSKLTLRFDLLAEKPGQVPAFDGEATVDLKGKATGVVAQLRRCVDGGTPLQVSSLPSR